MLVYLQLIDSPEEQSRFEELYITYRKLMFHVAKGILGNDQDAEDAVHDAFLSIAKNFDKISTEDRLKTKAFVVIVVENKAINIKKEARSVYIKLTNGERMKDLLNLHNLTLKELAEQTGLSTSALGSYETDDDKEISPYSVTTLAKFYGVSTDYLLSLTETKNHPNTELHELGLSDEMIDILKICMSARWSLPRSASTVFSPMSCTTIWT